MAGVDDATEMRTPKGLRCGSADRDVEKADGKGMERTGCRRHAGPLLGGDRGTHGSKMGAGAKTPDFRAQGRAVGGAAQRRCVFGARGICMNFDGGSVTGPE